MRFPARQRWLIVSVQGLHRFYRRRSGDVVAGWMTRQDRELAIADNRAFIAAVVDEVAQQWRLAHPLVLRGILPGCRHGLSRGMLVSTPRSAASSRSAATCRPSSRARRSAEHGPPYSGRGQRDEWYSADLFAADAVRLREAGVEVGTVVLDGGHAWTPAFSAEAGSVLLSTDANDPLNAFDVARTVGRIPPLPARLRAPPRECPAGDGVRSPPLGREDKVVTNARGMAAKLTLAYGLRRRSANWPSTSLPQHALVM